MKTIPLLPITRSILLSCVWIASGLSGLADDKPPHADGKTVIPKATLDRLDERLDVTFARYGDRTLQMDIYRPIPTCQCKELGINADHIGAIGHSAGGHLAALLATSAGVGELEDDGGNAEFSSTIQATVPMGGQTDFLSERNREKSASAAIWQDFLGGSQDDVPETYRLASPLAHLDKNDPPLWLISGENDDPSSHAESLRQKMDDFGISNGLTIIKDAPHPFTVKQVWFDQMMDAAVPFFNRTLKNQAASTDDAKE